MAGHWLTVSAEIQRGSRVSQEAPWTLSCLLVQLSEAHFQTGAGLPSETWLLYDCRQKHSFYSTATVFVWTVQSIPFVYRYMWLFFLFFLNQSRCWMSVIDLILFIISLCFMIFTLGLKDGFRGCFRLFVLSYSVYVQIYIEWLSSEAFLPTEGMAEQNPQSSFSANLRPKF